MNDSGRAQATAAGSAAFVFFLIWWCYVKKCRSKTKKKHQPASKKRALRKKQKNKTKVVPHPDEYVDISSDEESLDISSDEDSDEIVAASSVKKRRTKKGSCQCIRAQCSWCYGVLCCCFKCWICFFIGMAILFLALYLMSQTPYDARNYLVPGWSMRTCDDTEDPRYVFAKAYADFIKLKK